jgi:hypothetical protein
LGSFSAIVGNRMNPEKIRLLIESLEATIKVLKLELDNTEVKEEIEEQKNNTISLRELIGKMKEDEPEPDYYVEE